MIERNLSSVNIFCDRCHVQILDGQWFYNTNILIKAGTPESPGNRFLEVCKECLDIVGQEYAKKGADKILRFRANFINQEFCQRLIVIGDNRVQENVESLGL